MFPRRFPKGVLSAPQGLTLLGGKPRLTGVWAHGGLEQASRLPAETPGAAGR